MYQADSRKEKEREKKKGRIFRSVRANVGRNRLKSMRYVITPRFNRFSSARFPCFGFSLTTVFFCFLIFYFSYINVRAECEGHKRRPKFKSTPLRPPGTACKKRSGRDRKRRVAVSILAMSHRGADSSLPCVFKFFLFLCNICWSFFEWQSQLHSVMCSFLQHACVNEVTFGARPRRLFP